jgi:hypothetical protein
MPYPNTHMYLTVHGDAYGATEQWQFGLRLTDGGVSGQVTADAASGPVQSWWSNVNNGFIATHRLTSIKCAQIDVDGHYPPTVISGEHFYVPPVAGPTAWASNQQAIPQNSICVTLTTAVPRGHASKGRVFLPPQIFDVQADGLLIATDAATIAQGFRDLIAALNAQTVIGNVIVASRGKGVRSVDDKGKVTYTFPNPGAQNNVTGVAVGRVVDTQRRRRRSLTESRQSVVV